MLVQLVFVAVASSAPDDDEIVTLPRVVGSITFKQYSGYIEVPDPVPGNNRLSFQVSDS